MDFRYCILSGLFGEIFRVLFRVNLVLSKIFSYRFAVGDGTNYREHLRVLAVDRVLKKRKNHEKMKFSKILQNIQKLFDVKTRKNANLK